MSSSARSAFENPKKIDVSDFMRLANQACGKGPLPTPNILNGIIDKVMDKIAGDNWELRGLMIDKAMKNLRVLHKAKKQCLLNQKRKAEEAANGDTSATTHEVKADEMEK